MSSGSYLTIYRKQQGQDAPKEVLDALKNEYYLSNKRGIFGKDAEDEQKLKEDIPLLLDAEFKSERHGIDDTPNYVFYDHSGAKHEKLLNFCFGSTFTTLKDHFHLAPYSWNRCSTFISKSEVEKMLQAINYVLSENYSRQFEQILSNEYVELFGQDYSPFQKRFSKMSEPLHIDKDEDGFIVKHGDYGYDAEIAECDADVVYSLKKLRACFEAFLQAEDNSWDKQELVLEYSVYG